MEIKKVGVAGCGLMGHGITQVSAQAGYDVVVNATPLGSGAHIDQTPATHDQLTGVRCVYDLIYNPRETKLLREALAAGCETLGGLEMLIAQAKLQFELWTGKKPSAR